MSEIVNKNTQTTVHFLMHKLGLTLALIAWRFLTTAFQNHTAFKATYASCPE